MCSPYRGRLVGLIAYWKDGLLEDGSLNGVTNGFIGLFGGHGQSYRYDQYESWGTVLEPTGHYSSDLETIVVTVYEVVFVAMSICNPVQICVSILSTHPV